MLLEFKVKNFRSFKNEQTLSFEATKDNTLEDYYCININDNTRVLKVGIIYGSNASGKTNLLLALEFLRKMALYPRKRDKETGFLPFMFDESTLQQSGEFKLKFFIGDVKYIYNLIINKTTIIMESLYYYPSIQPALIYKRVNEKDGKFTFNCGSTTKLKNADEAVLKGNTMGNMTIISALAKTNIQFPELEKVYNWFNKNFLAIIQPKTDLMGWTLNKVQDSKQCKNLLIDLLSNADFNISDIIIKEQEIDVDDNMLEAINQLDLPSNVKKDLINDDKIMLKQLNFSHKISRADKSESYTMPDNLESSGTLRYFGLGGPLNQLITHDSFLSIDELENSLHPELVLHFLRTFLVNSKRSQMLFSTHNLVFLQEQDNIRKDVIWFAEKMVDGSSELYSMSDFDFRKNLSFINAYKAGKFGARPNLGSNFIRNKKWPEDQK
jgi:AAA15 family ATPase/GTPase